MRVLGVFALCMALVGLGSCSDEEASPPPTPEDSVGATTDTDQATDSAEPDDASTTTGPVADPGIPELPPEAREPSERGAAAFSEYYLNLINYVGRNPEIGLLEPYSTPSCSTCANFERAIAELARTGTRRDGPVSLVTEVQALVTSENMYRVVLDYDTPSYRELDTSGEIVDEFESGDPSALVLQIRRDGESYVVESVKSVEE